MRSRWPAAAATAAALASAAAPDGAPAASGEWPSYGGDLGHTRSQRAPGGIGAASAAGLRERWAVRGDGPVDGATPSVTANPAVAGGTVYWADWQGYLTAASAASGAVRWRVKVSPSTGPLAAVNSSPAIAGASVLVATGDGHLVAVSRATGDRRWSTALESSFATSLYSSPVVAGRTAIVGVSSGQNFFAGPYTFRGSVVGVDVRTGRIRWRTWVMRPGVDGPGGSVWSSAAVDRGRGLAYIGTGQAYAPPTGPRNDALLALRLRDGRIAWLRQFTRGDVWTRFGPPGGHDYDIGAAPNLFRIGRRAVVGAGDKSGRYAVLDRDTGRTIWRRALCRGSHLGGIMGTAAVARGSIWLACNTLSPAALDLEHPDLTDTYFDNPAFADASSSTAIVRLASATGRTVWRRDVPGGTIGSVTEAGGAVFVPATDGRLRALDAASGRVLATLRPGAPLAGGAAVAAGLLVVGYGVQLGGPERLLGAPAGAAGGVVAYGPAR
jgi:polyvinyl alcohol dehydrogenase (cytochrome)